MINKFREAAGYYARARLLQSEGVRERDNDKALKKFEGAKKLYTKFLSVQPSNSTCIRELTDVCENLASLYLIRRKQHRLVLKDANILCDRLCDNAQKCIQLSPTCYLGHYYHAEGLRMMAQIEFLKHNYYCTTVNLNMKDAFVHYLKCYELMGKDGLRHKERRKECFLHMIALGIQCGMVDKLPDVHKCDQDTMCTALLGHLINTEHPYYDTTLCTACVHYLLVNEEQWPGSGLATRMSCDASFFGLTDLWEKIDLFPGIVNALCMKGMSIKSPDITEAVDLLLDSPITAELLVCLCNHCQLRTVDLKLLYNSVLKQRKPSLAIALIHCGAIVNPSSLLHYIKFENIRADYAASLAKLCSQSQRSELFTDMLRVGNETMVRLLLNSGSLSLSRAQRDSITPDLLTRFDSHQLLHEIVKKVPPVGSLEKVYLTAIRTFRCKKSVRADLYFALLDHHDGMLEQEDVLWLVKNCRDRVAPIACQWSVSMRTKILNNLLEDGKEKAILTILRSGKIKADDVQIRTIAPELFTHPNEQLIGELLKKVSPCGPRMKRYLKVIQKVHPSDEIKATLYCLMLKNGAEVQILSPEKPTQVVHAATELALKTGNTELLQLACSLSFKFSLEDNENGQTPLHLAMKHQEDCTSMKVCELLLSKNLSIDPLKKDKFGKEAAGYAKSTNDKRLELFKSKQQICDQATSKQESTSVQRQGVKAPKLKSSLHVAQHDAEKVTKETSLSDKDQTSVADADTTTQTHKIAHNSTHTFPKQHTEKPIAIRWKDLLDKVLKMGEDYFNPTVPLEAQNSSQLAQLSEHRSEQSWDPSFDEEIVEEEKEMEAVPEQAEKGQWEVECTEKVVKFLKNNKRHRHRLRDAAMKKIERLGYERSQSLCKRVHKGQFNLFEAKLTESARILWGTSIQFSDQCTKEANKDCSTAGGDPIHICSEVVRVWDIVLKHDNLHKSIQNVVKSMERGEKANVKLGLVEIQNKPTNPNAKRDKGPREFVMKTETLSPSVSTDDSSVQFVPAASTREDEYNVLHFYSVSTAFVNSILNGEDARRDFPFKEWPKEHDIINMPQGIESILLLGRSGTGKTTCCLYRLWNEFYTYWMHPPIKEDICTFSPSVNEKADEDIEQCQHEELLNNDAIDANEATLDTSTDMCTSQTEQESDPLLHQVFITKNYVLCAQIRKKFYDMCASHHELLADHLPFESEYGESIPATLSSVDDYGYPLFLTSRQFLILLDNSINKTKDSHPFFPRDKNGNLAVTIQSSDYDHERLDVLLELEESDESDIDDDEEEEKEDEIREMAKIEKPKRPSKRWHEVTSLYFAEKIWPEICHHCQQKSPPDPLLVWMEIKSFIKGSAQAIESEDGYLTLDEYENLGQKMAVNFVEDREGVYGLFKEYQKYRQKKKYQIALFDECDLLHHIYRRLKKHQFNFGWSIDHFYIDEVQDFTQAELSIVLQCCRNPNGMFLTGDTAQSIMRGVSFRFEDVRTLFHMAQVTENRHTLCKIAVPKIHELEVNFRSHSGILNLAASVIHLLKKLFPASFDKLPVDTGLYSGPKPFLLISCEASDLAQLLQRNKRQSSSIEFGAHQVIIVQTDAAKQRLPDALKSGIALTVFEAKGLEFDDVLLYNFFHDSHIDKEWRVVVSSQCALVEDSSQVQDEHIPKPHPLKFNEREHKSLNPELKYLYTAITRTKCNLWIYDEDSNKHDPMFYYWISSGLVQPVKVGDSAEDDEILFKTNPSTPDEWEAQGNVYKDRHLWEPAIKCYVLANAPHLEKEAEAYMLAQQAKKAEVPKKKQQLYVKAAGYFLVSDSYVHNIGLLQNAAQCFRNAKQYNEAASLFEKLTMFDEAVACLQQSGQSIEAGKLCEKIGKMGKARKIYRRTRDYENLTRVLEKEQKYSEVIAEWDKIGKRFDALEKANEFEMKGYDLDKNMCTRELASKYAKSIFAQKKRRNDELIRIVRYLPLELRLKNLKLAGLFEEAVDVHVNAKQFKQAERLMSAQGLHEKAIKLAKKRGDKESEASFKFQQALSLTLEGTEKFIGELKENLADVSKCGFVELKGHAHLLLSRITQQKTGANFALLAFQKCINIVGELESFYQLSQCGQNLKPHTFVIIRSCTQVNKIVKSLRSSGKKTVSDDRNIKQALTFYHIYKEGREYVLSEHLNLCLAELKSYYSSRDEDGMVKLQPAIVCRVVAERLELVMKNLLRESVVRELQEYMKRFLFHPYIRDRHCLSESLLNYPPNILRNYLEAIEQMLAVKAIDDKLMTENPSECVIALFSPSVNWFLPFSKQHYQLMVQSKHISDVLGKKIQNDIESLQILEPANSFYNPSADSLLDTWKACSIIGQTSKLSDALKNDARQYLQEKKIPYHMIDRRLQDGMVYHFFQYWLHGCSLIRRGRNVTSAVSMIYAFLLKVNRRWSLNISVMNFVDIATVCTIGLISTISLANPGYHLLMPSIYAHVVKIFNDFNTQDGGGRWLLEACFDEVSYKKRIYGLRDLERRCTDCLFDLLKLMLGYSGKKHMLRDALSRRNTDGSAVYCLELCTVLVANLTILSPYRRDELSDCLAIMCHELNSVVCSGTIPQGHYIAEAHKQLSSAENIGKLFLVSQYLTKVHGHNNLNLCIVRESFRPGKNVRVSFVDTPIPLHFFRQAAIKPSARIASSSSNLITTSTVPVQGNVQTQQKSSPSSHAIPIIHPDSAKPSSSAAPSLLNPVSLSGGSIDQGIPSTQQQTAPDSLYARQGSTGEVEEDAVDVVLDEESARMMKESVYEPDTKPVNEKPTTDEIINIDRSIIDENFCGVCGEHLQEEQATLPAFDDEEEAAPTSPSSPPQSPSTESTSPPLTSQTTRQTLKEHLKCTNHKEKACAHKAFADVESIQYAPMKKKMEELLSKLISIEQINSEQETLCETCRQCLHKEREVDDHISKYEWREAYLSITSTVEEMDSLCKRLDCTIEDLRKENEISMLVEESENGKDHSSKDVPQRDEEEEDEEKEDERDIEYHKQPSDNVSQKRKKDKRKRMKG